MKNSMDIELLKALGVNDKVVLDNLLDFAVNVARTTRKHHLNAPSDKDVTECIDIVDDHLGFVPDHSEMQGFLWLHPELKSRVLEFGATDTEVRDELLSAILYFTLRTADFVEGDTKVSELVAQQWTRIWAI